MTSVDAGNVAIGSELVGTNSLLQRESIFLPGRFPENYGPSSLPVGRFFDDNALVDIESKTTEES
nr:hypothetical protein [Hyphomonas sp. Mor2]